jgi:hypothetical protein
MNYAAIGDVDEKLLVFEVATELIVRKVTTRKEAVKLCRWLNSGGAFDGWSPSFFFHRETLDRLKYEKTKT